MPGRCAILLALPLLIFAYAGLAQDNPDLPDLPLVPGISIPAIPGPGRTPGPNPTSAMPEASEASPGASEEEAPPNGTPDAAPQPDADTDSVSNDLPAHFATYLAGPGADDVVAVGITPAANLIVGGRLDEISYGGTLTTLIDGPASVFQLPPDGKPFLFHTRVGKRLSDMAVSSGSGRIALAGSLGVALLAADGQRFAWRDSLPINANRVAIAPDDWVALLDGRRIGIYDPDGRRIASGDVDHPFLTDIEIDSENRLVFVTGHDEVRDRNDIRVQSAFVEAYDFDLNPVWRAWGYGGAELGGEVADTHGVRLTIGGDGELYFLGEAAGGDSQFIRDPQTPARTGMLTLTDRYNTPTSRRRAVLAFYARLDRKTGRLKRAQYAFPRLGPEQRNLANTFLPRAIAADELGNVYVGGLSGRGIPDREKQTIAGQKIGDYGGDPALLIVSPDFKRRIRWTSFSAGGIGNHTRIDSIAVAFGLAIAGVTARGGKLVTVDALRPAPDKSLSTDQTDGYILLWRAP
ncbi:MAG: hypothetical protein RJQ21_13825 [Rhodospirillales bacterium]